MKKRWRSYAALLITLWAALVVGTFWLYQFRWISSYPEQQWISFLDDKTQNPWPDTARVTIAHIIDPSCPCSRFAYPHIASLEKEFADNTQFIDVDLLSMHKQTQSLLQKIPATPAVLIWNSDGKLAYFGPYSSGTFCGEGRDLVRLILSQLKQRINPEWTRQEAVGCFCPLSIKTSVSSWENFRKTD